MCIVSLNNEQRRDAALSFLQSLITQSMFKKKKWALQFVMIIIYHAENTVHTNELNSIYNINLDESIPKYACISSLAIVWKLL